MEQELRIAMVVDRTSAYARAILRGFMKFARPTRPWLIHTWPREGRWSRQDAAWLRAWQPVGILAQGLESALVEDVGAIDVPLVDVSIAPTFVGAPYAGVDHVAVGRMVAEEFLAQGLRNGAYFGWDQPRCDRQFEGFAEAFADRGVKFVHRVDAAAVPPYDEAHGPAQADAFLADWLRKLPKPLGLMLFDDQVSAWLTQPCVQAGLRVPEDVSIIGVNDDETNCQFAHPATSSVEVPGERVGYEAARMLDRLMQGQPLSRAESKILLPPVGVVTRQSSNLVAVEDADVASAVRFIRQNAHRPLRVSEVVDAVGISSRRLQQRFQRALGRTPADEIHRVHINRAAQLLAQTNLPLRTIATRSGFADIHHLCHAFRRVRELTPNQYRRQFAIGASPSTDQE